MSVDKTVEEQPGDARDWAGELPGDELLADELLADEQGDPQIDPHYLELLRSSKLPQAYLPAAMAGPQKPWVRIAATVIIGVLLLATVYGVCLTYGVGTHNLF